MITAAPGSVGGVPSLTGAGAAIKRRRCGFGTYFDPDRGLDHWVIEYCPSTNAFPAGAAPEALRHRSANRWVRLDPQFLGTDQVARPDDLADGEFLTGGEAWALHRRGEIDPDRFGVAGTEHAWGVAEIRGNAVRDLAALHGVEVLPWDEWGRMEASYQGRTGPDYDELMDRIAATCAVADPGEIARLYNTEDLAVPADLIR